MSNRYANLGNALKGLLRLSQTGMVLAQTGAGWVLGDRPPVPQLLRQTFERLGATYVKLGQFIASSPSLFPEAYVTEFQHCLDKTSPLPFSILRDVLQQELKRPLHEIFSHIDEAPLASASIAHMPLR